MLLPLLLYIVADHIFIAMLAHGTHKIPIAPKLTTPKLGFHRGKASEDFSCRKALYNLHYLLRTVRRYRLHQAVNVISIHPYFQKNKLIAVGNLQTNGS